MTNNNIISNNKYKRNYKIKTIMELILLSVIQRYRIFRVMKKTINHFKKQRWKNKMWIKERAISIKQRKNN